MRYFLDTEYNGFGGELIALALVPDEGEEFYLTLAIDRPVEPWVERHVLPYLDMVPPALACARLTRGDASAALEHFLAPDPHPLVLADWPEDIAQFCTLLLTGPGRMVDLPRIGFELCVLANFSTAQNSAVPHNALHDARALRDHVHLLERC